MTSWNEVFSESEPPTPTFERRFGCVTGDQNITLLHHQLKLAVRRVVDREKQHSACVFLLRQHQQR